MFSEVRLLSQLFLSGSKKSDLKDVQSQTYEITSYILRNYNKVTNSACANRLLKGREKQRGEIIFILFLFFLIFHVFNGREIGGKFCGNFIVNPKL